MEKEEGTDKWFGRGMNIRMGIIGVGMYMVVLLVIRVFVMRGDVKREIVR